MRRHIETFSRHRLALILPVVIALAVSSWYVRSTPKTYTTWMNVWFDTASPSQSSLEQLPNGPTPAQQGQAVLQEFLDTRQFLVNVGHRGTLAAGLARTGLRAGNLDSEIASKLVKAFSVTTTGPQVVQVTMTGHDPSYMSATLNGVAGEYVAEVTANLQSRAAVSVSYFQAEVQAAERALTNANAAVAAYGHAHPNATGTNDPDYAHLYEAAFQAQSSMQTANADLQQAQFSQQNVQAPRFHVIDAATNPVARSNKKHEILIAVAALFAGMAISVLALTALTSLDRTARDEEYLADQLGIKVAATISTLPRKRTLALGKAKSP